MRPLADPLKARAGSRSCAATSRRRAPWSNLPGPSARDRPGRRGCSSPRRTALPRSRRRPIEPGDVVIRNEGPPVAQGCEMLQVTAAIVGEGLGEEVALLTDGRFRGDPRAHGGPRRAGGPPRRADRGASRRRRGDDRRRRARSRSPSATRRSTAASPPTSRRPRCTRPGCSRSTPAASARPQRARSPPRCRRRGRVAAAPLPRPELPQRDREAKAGLSRARYVLRGGGRQRRRCGPRVRRTPARVRSPARPRPAGAVAGALRRAPPPGQAGGGGANDGATAAPVRRRAIPRRIARASDEVDFEALSIALPRCELVACDAFMADVIRRAGLDRRFGSEVFGGRRRDVLALRDRFGAQTPPIA